MSEELDHLIGDWLEGAIDADGAQRLADRLREPGAADRFAELAAVHHALRLVHALPADRRAPPTARRSRRRSLRRRPGAWMPWAVAAAALLAIGLGLAALRPGGPAPVPPLAADWRIDGAPFAGGAIAGAHRLERNGEATSVVTGAEARLALADHGTGVRLDLAAGDLDCTVAPQPAAAPFVVITAEARVVVVGTRFRVTAGTDATRVAVEQGSVRAEPRDGRPPRILQAGEATEIAAPPQVTGLLLIDARTGEVLQRLEDGVNVDRAAHGNRSLTVRAETRGRVGSVAMRLDGRIVQRVGRGHENTPPLHPVR